MGCAGSSESVKLDFSDVQLKSIFEVFPGESKNLTPEAMVNNKNITQVKLKADLLATKENFSIKTLGGQEIMKIVAKSDSKIVSMYSPKDEHLASMAAAKGGVGGMQRQYSNVYGKQTSGKVPHMYIYSLDPYMPEGQKESAYQIDGKPLYPWARVHVEHSKDPKLQCCEISYAKHDDARKCPRRGAGEYEIEQNADMFSTATFDVTRRIKDGVSLIERVWCFKKGMTEGKKYPVCQAHNDPKDPGVKIVTIGANVDPVLMLTTTLILEQLETQAEAV
jgi:hypothetical protein